jgi:AraC-like DNA-binding protein
LGLVELGSKRLDSALFYTKKALEISKRFDNAHAHAVLNTLALIYQEKKLFDSALYYFKFSLEHAKTNNLPEFVSEVSSNLGRLFFEINKNDSALYYIGLSNVIATEHNFFRIIADNYLTLSKIEKSKGRCNSAFELLQKHADLSRSVLNPKNLGEINRIQRMYEISITNRQIERLVMEQEIKKRTIRYHKIIMFLIAVFLLATIVILTVVFRKNKKLNIAYKKLFENARKFYDSEKHFTETHPKKYQKSNLSDEAQNELLSRIYVLMENSSVVCDPELTIDKLADLLQSNRSYVSKVLNDNLKKNFNSFINEHRIKEAQRLFSEPDASKYTVESIALKTGFSVPSTFYRTFKEITGVSPGFYLKSMQNL